MKFASEGQVAGDFGAGLEQKIALELGFLLAGQGCGKIYLLKPEGTCPFFPENVAFLNQQTLNIGFCGSII